DEEVLPLLKDEWGVACVQVWVVAPDPEDLHTPGAGPYRREGDPLGVGAEGPFGHPDQEHDLRPHPQRARVEGADHLHVGPGGRDLLGGDDGPGRVASYHGTPSSASARTPAVLSLFSRRGRGRARGRGGPLGAWGAVPGWERGWRRGRGGEESLAPTHPPLPGG